jgi:hypothetical protein
MKKSSKAEQKEESKAMSKKVEKRRRITGEAEE